MLKDISQIVRATICYTLVMASPYACAETTYTPVEIKCSNNPMVAQWTMFAGRPGVQYTLTTDGLREEGKEGIAEVVRTRYVGRTRDGLHMFVAARCTSSPNTDVDISLTGNFLECNMGDGIEVIMLEPNNGNPDKYHYVGTLAATRGEERLLKMASSNVIAINEEQPQPLHEYVATTLKVATHQLTESYLTPAIGVSFNSYIY